MDDWMITLIHLVWMSPVMVSLPFSNLLLLSHIQLSLRMSKRKRLPGPMSFQHGDRTSTPSQLPRSATGCSRAPSERTIAIRMSCKASWELRRRPATRSYHLRPVLLQSKWEVQGHHHHCQVTCLYPRLILQSCCNGEQLLAGWIDTQEIPDLLSR